MFSSNLSNFSEGVDNAFVIILSIIFFFLIGLTAALVYFIIRYRESKNPIATQIHGNNTLEILWTVIPLLLVLSMFYYGWTAFKPMEDDPPEDALHIETTARMWKWGFKYENGLRLDSLVVPSGKAISLDATAIDVIHSIYIPAFRIKKDIVPGSPRTLWFIANSPGTYDLFCTEYCGLEHSSMITKVTVMPQEEYDAFMAASSAPVSAVAGGTEITPALLGKEILEKMGCNACHTTDGTIRVGPSYLGLFGKEEQVISGGKERTITVDEAYIKKSIFDPNVDIVKGFNKGLMLSYEGQLSDEEIDQIVEYIKSMKE